MKVKKILVYCVEKNVEFFNIEQVVHIETTVLYWVNAF
jgi:hypothetical protein